MTSALYRSRQRVLHDVSASPLLAAAALLKTKAPIGV